MERIGKFIEYANEELILKILPILDNFEVAEKKLPEDLNNDENIKGLLLIKKQLLDFFKSLGVEEIRAVGEMFNPELHEVTEEVEPSVASSFVKTTEDKKAMEGKEIKSGMIIEETQKGYKINDRLLRPAKVKIAK
jgi:molecular chaperone GrpE